MLSAYKKKLERYEEEIIKPFKESLSSLPQLDRIEKLLYFQLEIFFAGQAVESEMAREAREMIEDNKKKK